MKIMARPKLLLLLGLVATIFLTILIYLPGLGGPFLLDDFFNLGPLAGLADNLSLNSAREFVFGNISGPTGRPVAMITFLLHVQDWQTNSFPFKLTNLIVHLACALTFSLIALLLSRLLGLSKKQGATIAVAVAAIWSLHPLNVSTTLYVIQRMTQLMTLFGSLSIVFYLLGRQVLLEKPRLAAFYLCLSLFPFALLSVLSKENGVLLLLLIISIDRILLIAHPANGFYRYWFRIGILVPVFIVLAYLIITLPTTLETYDVRAFSVTERLLTQPRILTSVLWKTYFPDQQLGNLFYDGYPYSTGLLEPLSTIPAIALLVLLVASAIMARKKQPVYAFAVFWFFSLHLLESTYIPLEMYFEHRNYFPLFGPIFAAAWYSVKLFTSSANQSLKILATVTIASLLLNATTLTMQIVGVWRDEGLLYNHMVSRWPESRRALLSFSYFLEREGYLEDALEYIQKAREQYPNDLSVLIQHWNFNCAYGFDQALTIAEIAAKPDLEHDNSLNFQLNRLLTNLQTASCEIPPQQDLIKLSESAGKLNMSDNQKASYFSNFANLHLLFGQPEQAIARLEDAFEYNPRVEIALRQATISGLFGDYERAFGFLELAKKVDRDGNILLPSRLGAIARVEQALRNREEDQLNGLL
jgi:tetratricopeptide (TPR) repeat protein